MRPRSLEIGRAGEELLLAARPFRQVHPVLRGRPCLVQQAAVAQCDDLPDQQVG